VLRRLVEGLECDIVDLSTCLIAPYDYEHNYPSGDEFLALIERIVAAPLTLIATPVYWYSYSTPTKIFIDRFSDLLGWRSDVGRRLRGRKFALVSTSAEPWPDRTLVEAFTRFCTYLGIEYVGCAHAQDAGEFVNPDAAAAAIRAALR